MKQKILFNGKNKIFTAYSSSYNTDRLLIFDPLKRLTATECLYHSFFMSYPLIGSVKLKESVHIPSNAFEHERWKPTLEEFRLEILKEGDGHTSFSFLISS